MSRCFETEMDDNISADIEKTDITAENEDETDQAKVCYHLHGLFSLVHFLAELCFLFVFFAALFGKQ